MKPGQPSKTAVLVCMGRALAHGDPSAPGFSDPTALSLLPEPARRTVERLRTGAKPTGWREGARFVMLARQSKITAARTLAIDEAVCQAGHAQVVILGAGLDGRAWRMRELADAVVFEVDHPDSQRQKRAAVEPLARTAREVRFVAVDFTRDDLDAALAQSGHDPALPTTWIWEGVVMYLTPRDVEATLEIVGRRSAPGSQLVIVYFRPAALMFAVGLVVRRMGEPIRSSFRPEAMQALLAKHGFAVVRDEGMPEIAGRVSPALAEAAKHAKHLRIVTARRA